MKLRWTLAALLASVACSSESGLASPTLISIEPAWTLESAPADVIIVGEGFVPAPERRFGLGVFLDSEFQARLGGVALEGVRRVDPTRIAAHVPPTLPFGTHDLEVIAPTGAAQLAGAFSVIPGASCPAGQCASVGPWPYAPSNFDPLALSPSANAAVDGCAAEFSTTTDSFVTDTCGLRPNISRVISAGQEATALAFGDLILGAGASLRLTGDRPAILAVFGNARIDGSVLANSTRWLRGAGSSAYPVNVGPCVGRAGGDAGDASSGGGGAGARDSGAAGGDHPLSSGAGGAGGGADPSHSSIPLRGGCPGGAPASTVLMGGGPGRGGGALQISARGELLVTGVVSASGSGGPGGSANHEAGYGGGSGGMVVLEGDRLILSDTAKLTANGGAGGGGTATGSSSGTWGGDGETASAQPAPGGAAAGGNAASGGAGGSGTSPPLPGGISAGDDGSGGGGASSGAIFVRSSPALCTVSPAAVVSPPAAFANCP